MEKTKNSARSSRLPRQRPPTTNYYRSGAASKSTQNSPFQKKSARPSALKKLFARAIDIVFIGGLVIGLGYSLIVNPAPRLEVDNYFYHSLENYRDSTRQHLSTIRDRNKITFDESGIVRSLMLDYPEIDNISIELPVFTQRPIVRIKIAAPSFVLANATHSYLIDANGKAIGLTSNFKKSASLPVISDQSNYAVIPGKAVLSSTDVAFIKSLIAESAKAGVGLDALILPTTPAELDVRPSGKNFIAKFHLAGDPTIQVGQFLAAMQQFSAGGEQPSVYLDVRVNGKIFYK